MIETLNRLTAARCEVTLLSRAMIRSNQLDWQLAKLGLDSQARRVVCTSGWGPEETEVQFRRLAGPQPGQVAYVGRDPRDLQAASRGGLLTIAFNYDADAQADVYIEQFDELLQVAELRDARMLAAG